MEWYSFLLYWIFSTSFVDIYAPVLARRQLIIFTSFFISLTYLVTFYTTYTGSWSTLAATNCIFDTITHFAGTIPQAASTSFTCYHHEKCDGTD